MSTVNQKCMSRPKILDINPNEPVFYPYSIKVNKCINERINETRQIVWHETCKCICR